MENKKGNIGIVIGVLFVSVIIILIAGFDTVDANHKGVMVELGKLKGTMNSGIQWTGIFTTTYQYDLRLKKIQVSMQQGNSAVDKDGQDVFATIEVNYRLNPENVDKAYSNVGTQDMLSEVLNIEGLIKEGFKTVTSEYSSLEIFQKREEVKQKAIEKIKENFPQEYFILDNVVISNIDFNPAFKQAIEDKKVAEESAKAREQEVFVAKYEADKIIETARGKAESAKLQSEAEAYQIEIKAKAEAEALRLKKAELTPLMVENNWVDAWNGVLPTYMLGGNTDILMAMPTKND